MKHSLVLSLGAAACFAMPFSLSAGLVEIDFEGIAAGNEIGTIYYSATDYVTFSYSNRVFDNLPGNLGIDKKKGPSTGYVIAFDSQPPTGNDDDLGTGTDSLGYPGNFIEPQNIIGIISKSKPFVPDPNDSAAGGVIRMEFSSPISLVEAGIIDFENNSSAFYAADTSNTVTEFGITGAGDGKFQTIDFASLPNVKQLDFFLTTSGALATLTFDTGGSFEPIPEPSIVIGILSTLLVSGVVWLRMSKRN